MDKAMLDYNIRVRLPILVGVALITYLSTFFYSFDERNHVGYAPEQPIPFSHKLHAGTMKIDCRYCHIGVEKSRHATVPSVDTCMNCHSVVKTGQEPIKDLRKYFDSKASVPWKRVHMVPDYVYFNHSIHVSKGLDCTECHGDIRNMDVVQKVRPLSMGDCLSCHRETHKVVTDTEIIEKNQGPQHCIACHR